MGAPDQAFTWPHRIYEWNSLNEPRLLGCHILLLLLLGWYDYNLGSPRMIVDDWNGGVQPAVLTWGRESGGVFVRLVYQFITLLSHFELSRLIIIILNRN